MRQIDDTEKFSAFIVTFRRVVTDDELYKIVWTALKSANDVETIIDCFVSVAKTHALNEMEDMQELLKIGSKYSNEEMDIIQESKQ